MWELDNLYAVGPALLPTMGSPNPMLSGVALAHRTADHLVPVPAPAAPEAGFRYLFDGTERTFQRWRGAGEVKANYFALLDYGDGAGGLLVAEPIGDHAVLFYAPERFGNFVLRLQFRLAGPVDQFGKAIGNSGVFVRFRYPHQRWSDVNQQLPQAAANPAWVAVATGFEVQVDEQGLPRFLDMHRTGALYDVPTGQTVDGVQDPQDQQYTPGPVLRPGTWYEYEIEVVGDTYKVRLREDQAPNFLDLTTFSKPAGKYATQGLSPTADPFSGYIGIQAHSAGGQVAGRVAFRNIRIRELP